MYRFDNKDMRMFSPEFYVEPFLDMNVACVVRLNEARYLPEVLNI